MDGLRPAPLPNCMYEMAWALAEGEAAALLPVDADGEMVLTKLNGATAIK